MPIGYQITEQSQLHYLTFQVVYWVDVLPDYKSGYVQSGITNAAQRGAMAKRRKTNSKDF